MHKSIRRAAYAAAGFGLVVTGALGFAAAPSAAQTTIQPDERSFLFSFEEFNVPSQPGHGDAITGHGFLKDDAGQVVGHSHFDCTGVKVVDAGLNVLCDVSQELTDGDLHFTFLSTFLPATGTLAEADAAVVGGTGAYLNATGSSFLSQVDAASQSYLWEHQLFLKPAA